MSDLIPAWDPATGDEYQIPAAWVGTDLAADFVFTRPSPPAAAPVEASPPSAEATPEPTKKTTRKE